MRGRVRAAMAGAVAVVLVGLVAGAVPAGAVPSTSGASAYAAAAGTGSAELHANLQLSGSLGKLLDPLINPIVDQALTPLMNALQGTANSTVAGMLGSSGNLNATTTAGQEQVTTAPAAFPGDSLPSPCLSSGSQPCFSAANANVSAPPLTTVQLGALTGYVEQVASSADATTPIFGRAKALNAQVSVLPGITRLVPGLPSAVNPLVSAAEVNAKANCPNDGTSGSTKPTTAPSASVSATSVTALGGLVTLDVLDGQITNLVIDGVSYPGGVLSLPTVTVSGVTISPYGSNAILMSIPITLDQIIAGFGLAGSVGDMLTNYAVDSTLALKIVIGPNSTVTSRTAAAWGLGIGVDLSGSLTFNLLNLVTASVNVPSGITSSNNGNLLDLRLAHATCQSGVVMPAVVPAVPAALV